MNLNLGCGKRLLPGYVNMDATGKADVIGDIRNLNGYADNTIDEILCVHVWEHFYISDVLNIAKEWYRVLIPGGKLILEMPCQEKVFDLIKMGYTQQNLTLWAMFGDPSTVRSEQDVHKWLWSAKDVCFCLEQAGFSKTEVKDPEFHVKIRDMRIEGIK